LEDSVQRDGWLKSPNDQAPEAPQPRNTNHTFRRWRDSLRLALGLLLYVQVLQVKEQAVPSMQSKRITLVSSGNNPLVMLQPGRRQADVCRTPVRTGSRKTALGRTFESPYESAYVTCAKSRGDRCVGKHLTSAFQNCKRQVLERSERSAIVRQSPEYVLACLRKASLRKPVRTHLVHKVRMHYLSKSGHSKCVGTYSRSTF